MHLEPSFPPASFLAPGMIENPMVPFPSSSRAAGIFEEIRRTVGRPNLTAGEPLLPGASIDLSVSATSNGFGTAPVELRVSVIAALIDLRYAAAPARRSPSCSS